MNEKNQENILINNNAKINNNTSNLINNVNKKDIKADNYNKSKVFELKLRNLSADLSRVDSQIDPDVTDNLDYIAQKMGLNQTNEERTFIRVIEPVPEKCSNKSMENSCENIASNDTNEQDKTVGPRRKSSFLSKIIRRFSKPGLDLKDNKVSQNKESSSNSKLSFSSENKSNNINPQRKSYMKIFNRFKKKKSCDLSNSTDSRPSVSSAVNEIRNVDGVESIDGDISNKVYKESLYKYNSPSVDCIFDARKSRLKHDSVSSVSDDLQDHERKMNASNDEIGSIFSEDNILPEKAHMKDVNLTENENKVTSGHISSVLAFNNDQAYLSPISNSSSNVKLTLSLHGYTSYELSSSRLTSKSCMEFYSALNVTESVTSKYDISIFSENLDSSKKNETHETCVLVTDNSEVEVNEGKGNIRCNENDDLCKEYLLCDGSDILLHKCERPHEIELRKTKVTLCQAITRNSLIMVAVAHNAPRSRGSTPVYCPESPSCLKKFKWEEQNSKIDEEQTNLKKDGNYFRTITDKCEEELKGKVAIVKGYLDFADLTMDDDVIGELNSFVGLATLFLNQKFFQFKNLCYKNVNEKPDADFPTLSTDLEGYYNNLESQIVQLNEKFEIIERIKNNNWIIPSINPAKCSFVKNKSVTINISEKKLEDIKRSQDAKKRLAAFKSSVSFKKETLNGISIQ